MSFIAGGHPTSRHFQDFRQGRRIKFTAGIETDDDFVAVGRFGAG